jgi:hypothetical protein
MLESGLSGSVRGVPSNGHPYRDPGPGPGVRRTATLRPLSRRTRRSVATANMAVPHSLFGSDSRHAPPGRDVVSFDRYSGLTLGGIMQRRDFLTLLGCATAWPFAARAQQQRRIGVLMSTGATDPSYVAVFVQVLRQSGWIDGQNLRLDIRWHENNPERGRALATELVATAPDVILTASTANLTALQQATRTIPIVFLQVSDPVAQGFVTSLAQPGGNITGFTAFDFSIGPKWLDLLKQMAPGLARVAVMFSPETPQSKFWLSAIEVAGPSLGVEVVQPPSTTPPSSSVSWRASRARPTAA